MISTERTSAPSTTAELLAVNKTLSRDLRQLDGKYRQLLSRLRENNPPLDEMARKPLSIPVGHCSRHERPYKEREMFEERLQAEIERRFPGRANYVIRFLMCNFDSIPKTAKGTLGVDRNWSAYLCLGSIRHEVGGDVIGASYEIHIDG